MTQLARRARPTRLVPAIWLADVCRRIVLAGVPVEHKGAAPDLAADQAALAHQRIGAADRADCHADVVGEVALRRQLRPGRENALRNVGFDLVGKPQIQRAGAFGEIGKPICHRDNFIYCTNERVNSLRCSDTIVHRDDRQEMTMSTIHHIPHRYHDAVFGRTRASHPDARRFRMIEGAVERRRSRLALMELTDVQLKDIGISRSEAYREANRPFWG